jgi:pyruvate kinase
MLSGETTVGKYPAKSVEYLDKIARESERSPGMRFCENLNVTDPKQPFGSAAVSLAEQVQAKCIVAITRSGRTANLVSNCRPREMIIHAFTNSVSTFHQLALSRNVLAHRIKFYNEPEKTLAIAFKRLKEEEGFQAGDRVVVLSDILAGSGIDAIQVRSIP